MKILKAISAAVILSVIMSLFSFNSKCEALSGDIFRLHILANSDSERDQELKLRVRDRILKSTEYLYKNCESKADTISVTQQELHSLEKIAEDELKQNGCDYEVSAEITNMYFNVREYGRYTVPSGYYDALRLTIGEGKGHNWWCVMYPSFCMGECTAPDDSGLSDTEIDLISDTEKYKVKFKIFEVYQDLVNYLVP